MHAVATCSAQIEDIRSQAHTALASVREEFQGSGGMSFEQAQMLINSGIDAGKEVILRHSSTIDNVLQEMMTTDHAAGKVVRDGWIAPVATERVPGEADRVVGLP